MPPRFKQIGVDKDDVECSGSKKALEHSKQKSLASPFGSVGIRNIKITSRKRDKELYL